MSGKTPTPPSPDASPARPPDTSELDSAFDDMLLDRTVDADSDFIDDWGVADTEEALALSGIDETRLKDCIVAVSASVWGVRTMRPAQLEACYRLLHPHHPDYLVVVHRTGGGKTHILRTLGVIERGMIFIFIPLLTLSADVMHKFEDANTTWGNVGAYHLDELYDSNRSAFTRLMWRCLSIERSTTSMLFLFLSPQFLVNHHDTLNDLVTCARERTLRVIAMDEAHVHVQHGTSFRDDIRALRVEFSRQIYGNKLSDRRPHLIALSATFPTSYICLLSNLLTVDFNIDNCILRGSEQEFSQREIEMKLEVCGQKSVFISKGLSMVTEFLDQNRDRSVVIFCNSRNQSLRFFFHPNHIHSDVFRNVSLTIISLFGSFPHLYHVNFVDILPSILTQIHDAQFRLCLERYIVIILVSFVFIYVTDETVFIHCYCYCYCYHYATTRA